MKRSYFLLLLILGLSFTILGGMAHGRFTLRWGIPPDIDGAVERVGQLPEVLGNWRLEEERAMDGPAVRMLQCAGHVLRVYRNMETNQTVTMFVIVGPPGPTAVHTPEICYSSRDYEISHAREVASLTDGHSQENTFWKLTLDPRTPGNPNLSVYYAWSPGDRWLASEQPRFEFGGKPYLYKLQLAGVIPILNPSAQDPGRDFLEALLRSDWQPKAAAP